MIALEGQVKERLVSLDDSIQSAFGIGARERVENPVPHRERCLQRDTADLCCLSQGQMLVHAFQVLSQQGRSSGVTEECSRRGGKRLAAVFAAIPLCPLLGFAKPDDVPAVAVRAEAALGKALFIKCLARVTVPACNEDLFKDLKALLRRQATQCVQNLRF